MGDTVLGAAGIDEYTAAGLYIDAKDGVLSISYSHSQCGDTCRWVIMDNDVRFRSFSCFGSCSTGYFTHRIDLDKMKKYVTQLQRSWERDEASSESTIVDEITEEEYTITYEKEFKCPTFEEMNFVLGDHGLHYKEKLLKSEKRIEY